MSGEVTASSLQSATGRDGDSTPRSSFRLDDDHAGCRGFWGCEPYETSDDGGLVFVVQED